MSKKMLDEIDNYQNTIYAIVGFINFYRLDNVDGNYKQRSDVKVGQGRKLSIPGGDDFVTPDICIVYPDKKGVLGEVKISFSEDQTRWVKTFKQLMSYDNELNGWPTIDEKISTHDVVLLLHQTRGAVVTKYYEAKKEEFKFKNPFCIIEFNRSDGREHFMFFRMKLGTLSESGINDRLTEGVAVPMNVFTSTYSTVKIYDSPPPLPYLIMIIWENVFLRRAVKDGKFQNLTKRQTISVYIGIDEIVDELYKGFSFKEFHGDGNHRQQQMPKKEWIINAVDKLVQLKEANWLDPKEKTKLEVIFKKYDSVLEHFVEVCESGNDDGQIRMFENTV